MTDEARIAALDALYAAVRALQPHATQEDIPTLLAALEGVSGALDRLYAAGVAAGLRQGLLIAEIRLDRRDPDAERFTPEWRSVH